MSEMKSASSKTFKTTQIL